MTLTIIAVCGVVFLLLRARRRGYNAGYAQAWQDMGEPVIQDAVEELEQLAAARKRRERTTLSRETVMAQREAARQGWQ